MTSTAKEYGYIAYIDEAGDPGLKRVRPIDDEGGTEWLILSAVVIRTLREPMVKDWVENIIAELGIKQRNDLHYRTLSPTRRIAAGQKIATLPLRGFAICSNKKNMRGHRNKRAETIPSQQWFYNWCIRLLLERVTAFCASRTQDDYGKVMPVKIEFSERGGIRYSQSKAYQHYLKFQQQGDKIYLKKREPVMQILDWDLMEAHAHSNRAGLQLSDFVASAFFQAADILDVKEQDIRPATMLKPIMAKESGCWHDFGVALFPTPARTADLKSEQKQIFEQYGYDFAMW